MGSSPRRRDRQCGFRLRDAACDPSGLETVGGPHSRRRRPSARRSFGTSDRQPRLDRRASPSGGDRVAQPDPAPRPRSSDPLRADASNGGRSGGASDSNLIERLTSRRGRSRCAAEPRPKARQKTHRSGLGWNVARSRPPTSDRLPPGNQTREQFADLVERIVLAAPMAERLVLHALPNGVEATVRDTNHMERVGDPHGVRRVRGVLGDGHERCGPARHSAGR